MDEYPNRQKYFVNDKFLRRSIIVIRIDPEGFMKIAVSGKGGVGKTSIAAAMALLLARRGKKVLALDADPDANLAAALGIPAREREGIVSIARQRSLVEERTGAGPGDYGGMFKLNPEVSDIADAYAFRHNGVALLVLGAVEGGGSGCACAESTLLRALVQDLVLRRDETLVMDMEAGIEHLGRATARGVDMMIMAVEPGQRSIDTVKRISAMAREIGITDLRCAANKLRSAEDLDYIVRSLPEFPLLGAIPFSEKLIAADRDGCSVLDGMDEAMRGVFEEMARKVE
jgi:CO dehydrogenase maturation factor